MKNFGEVAKLLGINQIRVSNGTEEFVMLVE